jgi:hypothetical protein
LNPIPNATYQWIDCDNNNTPIDGATNSTYSPTVSGNYAVIVNYLSCSETSLCGAVQVNGLNDSNWNFVVYPNPTTGEVVIKFNVAVDGDVSLAFVDGNGKRAITVFEQYMPSGNYSYSASLESLRPGTYYTTLTTPVGISVNKTILQK